MELVSPKVDNVICCLICNANFEGKPVLLATSEENDDGIIGEKSQDIHSAFSLLCKLLLWKGKEENGDDDVCIQLLGEMFENLLHPGGEPGRGNIWESPFCDQCYQGIGQVRKLEIVINETKTLQKCILDDLKASLISSHSPSEGDLATRGCRGNRVRVAIRRQLILNLGSEETQDSQAPSEQRMHTDAEGRSAKWHSEKSAKVKNRKICSRKSSKRGLNLGDTGDPPPPANKLSNLLTLDNLGDVGEACSLQKSKILEVIYRQDSNSPPSNSSDDHSDWHEEEGLMISASEDDEGEEMPVPKPTKKKKGKRPRSNQISTKKRINESSTGIGKNEISTGERQLTKSHWYWIIPNKNLLILVHSLIKYDYMQRLDCLERGCGHVVKGTSDSSFEEMRQHVLARHPQYSCGKRTSRKCPFCGENVYWLKSHLNAKHPDLPELQILCEICWKPLKSKTPSGHLWFHKSGEEQADLTAQQPSREERYTLECKECGRKFCSRSNLVTHERTHMSSPKPKKRISGAVKTKAKPVQCKLCPSILANGSTLKGHMFSQHNVRDGNELCCPICDKKFAWKSSYEVHYRTHTNERPFVCEICGKAFTHEAYLKDHSMAHTSEKQFQCQFCGAEFKYRKGMRQHCRLRHPEMVAKPSEREKKIAAQFLRQEYRPDFIGPKQMFPCHFCEKVFQWKCRMKKHVRLSHSQGVPNFEGGEEIWRNIKL